MRAGWIVAVLALLVVGCAVEDEPTADDAREAAEFFAETAPVTTPPQVVYDLAGSAATVFVTMQNESGGTEQFETSLPYSRTIAAPHGGFVYISAQNQGASGDVSCTVRNGPFVIQTASSSGGYTIATCSGSVG